MSRLNLKSIVYCEGSVILMCTKTIQHSQTQTIIVPIAFRHFSVVSSLMDGNNATPTVRRP